jgi:endoglucanase
MNEKRLLSIAKEILTTPTAPLHEEGIQEVIRKFCEVRQLPISEDRWGNLIVTYQRGTNTTPIAFEAHMDHPGFEILEDAERGGTATAKFLGGVNIDFFKGSKVRVFARDNGARKSEGVRAVVTEVDRENWAKEMRVSLRVSGAVRCGDFAMWDLVPFAVRGGKIHTRACDDLIGCISILAMLDELVRQKIEAHVLGVFTRAEEIGFLGALTLAKDGTLPRDCVLVGIETSKEIPAVKMGNGPIIRVGDRATVFHSGTTYFLTQVGVTLQKANPQFKFQRALMDGGTCNSTVYHWSGYRTGAMCVALGNYHNHGANKKIAAEYISLADLSNMVEMFVAAAREANRFDEICARLDKQLTARHQQAMELLKR